MSYQNVLDKLLANRKTSLKDKKNGDLSQMVENFFQRERPFKKSTRKVGRPIIDEKLKAKNFTICMAHNYVKFLDAFKPPIKKIQGRGRKLRFIIDEFIKMSKRQRGQLKYLQQALASLEDTLSSFSDVVKKGEKLSLSTSEKKMITTQVNRVKLLAELLCFTPAELKKILPLNDWNLYSFCLHWKEKDRT